MSTVCLELKLLIYSVGWLIPNLTHWCGTAPLESPLRTQQQHFPDSRGNEPHVYLHPHTKRYKCIRPDAHSNHNIQLQATDKRNETKSESQSKCKKNRIKNAQKRLGNPQRENWVKSWGACVNRDKKRKIKSENEPELNNINATISRQLFGLKQNFYIIQTVQILYPVTTSIKVGTHRCLKPQIFIQYMYL